LRLLNSDAVYTAAVAADNAAAAIDDDYVLLMMAMNVTLLMIDHCDNLNLDSMINFDNHSQCAVIEMSLLNYFSIFPQ
jgi:hypothetical protein